MNAKNFPYEDVCLGCSSGANVAPPMKANVTRTRVGDSALAARLRREIEGEVLFDAFSRGRYSTAASINQTNRSASSSQDRSRCRGSDQIAADEGIPVIPRAAVLSDGQAIGQALIIDFTKHLTRPRLRPRTADGLGQAGSCCTA
jgi:hypothetical protein